MMKNSHLEYETIDDWIAGENVPPNFVSLDDATLSDKYIAEC
jgi:hypothetical protein